MLSDLQDPLVRISKLQSAKALYDTNPEYAASSKAIDAEIRLVQAQSLLEGGLKSAGKNMSTSAILYRLIFTGQISHALKLKADFKVTEKRYVAFSALMTCFILVI